MKNYNNKFGNNNTYQNWNNNHNNNRRNTFNYPNQYNHHNLYNNPYINYNPNLFRSHYNPNYNNQGKRQQNNRLYNNNNNNNTKLLYNTFGYKFNGTDIEEINLENKNGMEVNKLMSIVSRPEYDFASPEELRLSDDEKFKKGKVTQFRIINTKINNNKLTNNKDIIINNTNINNNLPNNQSLFNNNNDSNKNKSLFLGINTKQGVNVFDSSNENKEKPLFDFTNNNKGKSLFENTNTFQLGGNFGNNNFNPGSLFNDNSIFKDNTKDKNKEISFLGNLNNDKSLFNFNNPNPININNKPLFGGENNIDFNKKLFENKDTKIPNQGLLGNEQTQISSGQSLFGNNKPLFPLGNQTKEANKNTISSFDKKINNPFNCLENNQKANNKQEKQNYPFFQNNNNSPNTFNNEMNINQNQNQSLLLNHAVNTKENKNNINITYNHNNNDNDKNQFYTLNDIVDPLKNFHFNNQIENKSVSEEITKTIQSQKPINQFIDELEQKYENSLINENFENKDILDNYGTYQDYNNNYNRYFDEMPSCSDYNDNNQINNYIRNDKTYNFGKFDNSKPKVSSIYEEYEKIKSQYLSKSNNNNKSYNKQNLISNNNKINDNNNNETNKFYKNDNQNEILGRNNELYEKNILEMDKLINASLTVNNNSENIKEKNEKVNNIQNIEEVIVSNLPKKEEKNLSKKNQENIIVEKFESYSAISNNNCKENNNNKEKELAPLELVPKLTKEGYKCNPSLVELGRKTKEELTKIEGFKISNKYGEVEFKEPVNLLGVDLDDQINIEQNLIDTGDKLDYRSIFKLYNFKVKENELDKYKTNLEKEGGNFVGYKNNEIVWEYNKN